MEDSKSYLKEEILLINTNLRKLRAEKFLPRILRPKQNSQVLLGEKKIGKVRRLRSY